MPISLGDVIARVRNEHPSFTQERVPNLALARFYTNYQRQLISRATRRNRYLFATPFVVDVTALNENTINNAIAVPQMHYFVAGDIRFVDSGREDDVRFVLVGYQQRFQRQYPYAGYITGTSLYLIGPYEDWRDVASINCTYTPIATPLTALADLFILPDDCEPAIVAAGAWHAAQRVAALEPKSIDLGLHKQAKEESEMEWLKSISARRRGERNLIREW